ncbi:hypothetical protein B0H11DRAFT_2244122 [Mycena galericulata]|nr:hypothetical protein B0H11DRAFT_2244122 [Mycena galericulata]
MDPEDEAYLRKNPDCIPPLGVATVFQEPVSVLQISRVLNLEPEVTLKRLRTMSRHLDHPLDDDVYSVVAIKESPRKWIFSRAESGRLCLALTEYNNRVAQWCLADANNYDVRDIEYATKYWIYHICQSIPSQMLCKTIMTSRFVDLRSWSKKLEEIKTWLRKYSDSDDFAVFGIETQVNSATADRNIGQLPSYQQGSREEITLEPTATVAPLDSTSPTTARAPPLTAIKPPATTLLPSPTKSLRAIPSQLETYMAISGSNLTARNDINITQIHTKTICFVQFGQEAAQTILEE